MFAISGDIVTLYATVKRWAAHFKMDKESPEDDDSCGRHTIATTEENIAHVHRVVLEDDRRLTVNQTANAVGISREPVENILHNVQLNYNGSSTFATMKMFETGLVRASVLIIAPAQEA